MYSMLPYPFLPGGLLVGWSKWVEHIASYIITPCFYTICGITEQHEKLQSGISDDRRSHDSAAIVANMWLVHTIYVK